MQRTRTVVMLALLLMLSAGVAHAAEQLGVTVYAGAKAQAAAKAIIDMMPGSKAYCYVTGDPVDKAVAFNRQQDLQYVGGDAQNAMFKKGKTDDTVQRPWMHRKTGPLNPTTLISIVQPAR